MGKKHERWESGSIVFVDASTGLGKSYWYSHKIYEFALQQGKEMAVLLNRRLLKAQIVKEIRKYDMQQGRYQTKVHIILYQELEADGQHAQKVRTILKRCQYIICDEAHYFCADALFNARVQRSFDFITDLYRSSSIIFISATMERVRPVIEERILELYNEEYRQWEEGVIDNCYFKKNGKNRSLGKFQNRLEQYSQAFDDLGECQYVGGPTAPKGEEYTFLRDISGHLDVKYFENLNEMLAVIQKRVYDGKWLIFVLSKSKGKRLRDELSDCGISVTYVDAEYDKEGKRDEWQEEALREVNNIRYQGQFSCDVLITTAVLDNGVNIKDPRVKNIVLLTDDEVSFKQMLGRRRFQDTSEKLNVFISHGEASDFRKRADYNAEIYWKLCERRDIGISEAYSELRLNPQQAERLLSFYDFNGVNHHCHRLTIEAVRLRSLYCEKVAESLMVDDTFFLQEQLRWMGRGFSREWYESSNVRVSQIEISELGYKVHSLYHAGGIFDKPQFKEFTKKIMETAVKIDPKRFNGKQGNITTVNNALKLMSELENYSIHSFGDRYKNYELLYEGTGYFIIDVNISMEDLERFLNAGNKEVREVFEHLFKKEPPACLSEEELQVFINLKMKQEPNLRSVILKKKGKKLHLEGRGNTAN